MKCQFAQQPAGYMVMALGAMMLALAAAIIAVPASAAGVRGDADVPALRVQDTATEVDALQVMMFLHRQGAVVASTEEGR